MKRRALASSSETNVDTASSVEPGGLGSCRKSENLICKVRREIEMEKPKTNGSMIAFYLWNFCLLAFLVVLVRRHIARPRPNAHVLSHAACLGLLKSFISIGAEVYILN
jgi:hypothetical protein